MPFLKDAKHLIVDRDTSFIAMREFLEQNTDTEVGLTFDEYVELRPTFCL